LTPVVAFASAVAGQVKTALTGLSREVDNASLKGRSADTPRLLEAAQVCQSQLQELLSDVSRVLHVKPDELPALVDASTMLQSLVERASVRADHGIAATPRGGKVHLTASYDRRYLVLQVDDGGASVPSGTRDALIWLRIDPSTVGRPRGVHLLSASAILSSVHGSLEILDAPGGGTRVIARVPAP
jgi:signal transduction histidine kinase